MDNVWEEAISDVLINLSAAWLGLVLVTPFTGIKRKIRFEILTANIIFSIVSLILAVHIKIL